MVAVQSTMRVVTRRALGTIAVLTSLTLALTGCGRAAGRLAAHGVSPTTSPAGVASGPAVSAIDGLAADLYRRLAATPGNLVFSPYSIEMVLAAARDGATGQTRSEMDRVLRAGSADELDRALHGLGQLLDSRAGHRGDKQRNGDVSLATANSLWGQRDTVFEQRFVDVLAAYYGAGMGLVDYASNPDTARADINHWASDRTKGKIVDLLPPGSVNRDTRLVLANAIYFKAPWAKKFNPSGDPLFTLVDGSTRPVPAMAATATGSYGEGAGWKGAEIPYLGADLSMVVVVPDNLPAFEPSLDGSKLASIINGLKEPLTSVRLPKFGFRSKVALKDQLSQLGMPRAFSDTAEFSGITKAEHLKIKDVFHQAYIAVDEEGTEASAATAVVSEITSLVCCKSLVVDKPFLFAVRDTKTGTVLFLGRVTDPASTL